MAGKDGAPDPHLSHQHRPMERFSAARVFSWELLRPGPGKPDRFFHRAPLRLRLWNDSASSGALRADRVARFAQPQIWLEIHAFYSSPARPTPLLAARP